MINYEAIAAELPSLRALLRFKKMALVLDESHRIETPAARVTRAIHALRADAARRYIMTGTPVANKPEDLWAQVFFLDDGRALGSSFRAFRERFCTSLGRVHAHRRTTRTPGDGVPSPGKEDRIDLPAKTFTYVLWLSSASSGGCSDRVTPGIGTVDS